MCLFCIFYLMIKNIDGKDTIYIQFIYIKIITIFILE